MPQELISSFIQHSSGEFRIKKKSKIDETKNVTITGRLKTFTLDSITLDSGTHYFEDDEYYIESVTSDNKYIYENYKEKPKTR